MSLAHVAILIPAFNPDGELGLLLDSLRARAPETFASVIVYLVDDGSRAPLQIHELPEPTEHFGVVLLRHVLNLGQGAALETARVAALLREEHNVFVTMDADGQHLPSDLPNLVAPIIEGRADIVFGNRFRGQSNVPFLRRCVLWAARLFEKVLTGLPLADAHNGYRAFGRVAAVQLRLRQNRMAHATEIKQLVARVRPKLRIEEVPVTVRYSRESLEKGQSSTGAIAILRDLFYRFLFGPE